MQKAFVNALKATLFVLLTASAALAVVSPHTATLDCYGCHTLIVSPTGGFTIDMSNISGVDNLCFKCHKPELMEKSFGRGDLANPFGTTDIGTSVTVRKQTSHNWAAPLNAPAAGASTPLDPALSALLITKNGVVGCGSCHGQHDSTLNNLNNILRETGDRLCLDCHRARNQKDVQKGTHPVDFDYATSKVALKPGEYQPTPVNANPANPTSAMKLLDGKLSCSTCHGIHFSDSNARTFDNASSSRYGNLSTSQGFLLRTDMRGGQANDINICTNCHAGKTAHNRKDQNIQCADCHAAHVDPGDGSAPNVWLVRRYMNYSGGVKLDSYRRKVLNQNIGDQSNFAGAYGVCQGCHAVPAPGGSYPSEHASADPNVCRSCHTHGASAGSFSADCKGCHGFPPQQNVAFGPQGYAKNTQYDYATSGVFKDEAVSGHLAHAGGQPYSLTCNECHAGNKHATGNFQQVFNLKTGIMAATGGAAPIYNANGTCSNVYCHSNGAPIGGIAVYKTPAWANAKNSIIGTTGECNACHEASPTTNAHGGHLSFGFACVLCHSATVDINNKTNISKHVNGIKEVQFLGTSPIANTGVYNSNTTTCSNLYCHSNGNQGALVYVNPPAWTSGAKFGCNGCHGTSSPLGAPDYVNGGAGTILANSHSAHVAGLTAANVCSICHFVTASSTAANTLASASKHLSGTVDVVFNPAIAGPNAKYNSINKTCENVACHGNALAQWGGKGGCLGCHSASVNNRAAVTSQFSGNSHHVQGVDVSEAHCYQCHWEANSDGSINHAYHHSSVSGSPVELVVYGTGTRPTAYVAGTTAVQYTADGTRTELAKINAVCLGCHNDANKAIQPFGDGKTPAAYAWDANSIAAKFGDTGTTPWGKYAGTNVSPKSTVTKAFSAHGNAVNNKGGWNTSETWTDRLATSNVLCFDCHNSHGSSVAGTTTSYTTTATVNGGILKDTAAGKGGYTMSYKPVAGGRTEEHNIYNPGAAICFDCHMKGAAGITPWGYKDTFGSTQQIMNYWDSPYFGNGPFGPDMRFPYKAALNNFGGHFGASSALSSTPAHQVGGLCTPCHDPHGVSPTLGANKIYGVPLLKGTWMTSPYKEDVATADNQAYTELGASRGRGSEGPTTSSSTSSAYQAAINTSFHIDQNTFASGSITQTVDQFAGLCLNCHAKTTLTNGTNHTWKSKDRIHESVKGWKTANSTIKHNYSCSKCHAPHNTELPRLMVTNCLDYNHRGRVIKATNPVTSGSGGRDEGRGGGHMPGIYDGGDGGRGGWGRDSSWNDSSLQSGTVCHDNNDSKQQWNTKTPWTTASPVIPPVLGSTTPTVPVLVTEPNSTCAGACTTALQWNAATNADGAAIEYQVQVSSSSSFTTVNYSSGWITGNSWTATLSNGTWYWRIQARNSAGISNVSAWSTVGSFTQASAPPAPPTTPMLVAEPDASCASTSGCSFGFQWNPSTNNTVNAIQYSVQVSSSSSFSTIKTSSGWITGTTWSATLPTGTWYWRVQARDSVTTTLVSAWSASDSFVVTAPTAPTVPVLVAEPDGTCTTTSGCATALQWNTSTTTSGNAIQYSVQVSSSSSFSTINTTSGWITDTTWSPTLASGTWYWRVQARDSVTTTLVSAWSASDTFIVSGSTSTAPPTAPVLVAEPDGTCSSYSGCSIGMQWNPSTNPSGGSIQYQVQVSSSSTFSTIKSSSSWQTGTSWSVSVPKGTWYWRVQARDAAVTTRVSSWSSTDTFVLR